MEPLRVGIIGLGTVGKGTYEVLMRNAQEIARRAGRQLVPTQVSQRNLDAARKLVGDSALVVADPRDIVRAPDIDIVVELIGGDTLAKELVIEAMNNGKHVVTANKALLAKHGNELFELAREKQVMLAFEAAVAGGIPVIKAIREGLTANRIEWVAGIINGTTNFILSEMRARGLSFETVLKEAQELGYAEADPTFDVEGVDAAHKLSLLASIAFGVPVQFERAYIEGISQLSQCDIQYAEELGYRVKLLGITKRQEAGFELRVHPTLVPKNCLIASVEGAMNAVLVKGDAVGATLYYGAGAGAEPTASAVVADLVDVARLHTADPENHVPHLAFQPDSLSSLPILNIENVVTSYYLRVSVADAPGVLADIARVLANNSISIVSMVQKTSKEGQADLVFLTHEALERNVDAAIKTIQNLPIARSTVTRLRLENLDG